MHGKPVSANILLMNVTEKTVICKRKPVPGITLTIGIFFDGTGNNAFNTQNRILESCSHLDVGMKPEDAEACAKKLGKKLIMLELYWLLF
jgi:hypothetical protein